MNRNPKLNTLKNAIFAASVNGIVGPYRILHNGVRRDHPPYEDVQLSKAERRGKSPEAITLARIEKWARSVGLFHCPLCGAPVDNDGKGFKNIPAWYNPEGFPEGKPHPACLARYEAENASRIVTHDMALDAGIPELEGTEY